MLGVRRMTSRARSQSGRQHLCFGVSVSPDRGSIALATAHASQGGVKAVPSNTVAICGSCSFWSRGHAKSARLRCAIGRQKSLGRKTSSQQLTNCVARLGISRQSPGASTSFFISMIWGLSPRFS